MAINPNTQYPGKIAAPSVDYPYGEAQNITLPGDGTGTPWEAALVNDLFGFQQAMLDESSIVPSGTPEKATASQYLEALKILLKSGRKNALIGNFRINQRVVTGTVILAAGEYGHDRFRAGLGGCTYTFATSVGITTVTISAGTLEQEIEGNNLVSDDYILSWTGTAQAQIDGGGFGITGVTATLVGGTNSTVEWNTGSISLPQLEMGNVATPFEHRNMQDELAMCHRYFSKSYNINTAPGTVTDIGAVTARNSIAGGGTFPGMQSDFPVTMRTTPTIAWYSPGTGTVANIENFVGSIDIPTTGETATGERTTGYPVVSVSQSDGTILFGHWTAEAEL